MYRDSRQRQEVTCIYGNQKGENREALCQNNTICIFQNENFFWHW